MSSRAIFAVGFSLFGLLITYALVIVGLEVPKITGSYLTGAVAMAVMIFCYFNFLHPRLRRFPGHEYSALIVGFSSMLPLATIFLALTHAEIR